jgi:hypothetical protein
MRLVSQRARRALPIGSREAQRAAEVLQAMECQRTVRRAVRRERFQSVGFPKMSHEFVEKWLVFSETSRGVDVSR